MGVLAPFFLLLVDITGATYRARIPVTACGLQGTGVARRRST
jgi:hypothetical protein